MATSITKVYDAIILGAGPAGLSTALALARVRRSALILSHNVFRNDGVTAMHNVLSRDGSHPEDFRRIAWEQIESYGPGIEFTKGDVIRLTKATLDSGYQGFEVEDASARKWQSKKLVLAMGSEDIFPDIEGYAENWPENIYQCLFCDGIERAHRPIGLLDVPPGSLLHMAIMASHLTNDPSKIAIFTARMNQDAKMREVLAAVRAHGCVLEHRQVVRLSRVQSPESGVEVVFSDGESGRFGFLLAKPPTQPVGENMIVDNLGVEVVKNMFGTDFKRNEVFGESNVKGVFVAGDAGTMMKAVTVACASGCLVGGAISSQLCTEEGEEAMARVKGASVSDVTVEARDATGCSS